ncbi:MAG: PLD nuclease N-terminal domain-containing protein [Bacillota bacterium]
MDAFDLIMKYLPIFIPIILIQLGLMIAALVSILRSSTFKVGNKPLWIVIAVCVNIIGPILYFIIGRDENQD